MAKRKPPRISTAEKSRRKAEKLRIATRMYALAGDPDRKEEFEALRQKWIDL